MASWQTRAVCLYLRATRKARYSTTERGLQALANGIPPAAPPRTLEGRLFTEQVAGFEISKVRPSANRSTMAGVLVYLHGGAFVNGIAKQHWDLVSFLADATGHEVWVPQYGLAPAHGADDARAFLEAVHDQLRDDRAVHLLGDSAGGNLALLLAQARTGDRSIVGLTLIAPWLDLSISNPQIDAVEPHDPFGTRDICLPDSRLLRDRAKSSGSVTLHEDVGSPHVYPLQCAEPRSGSRSSPASCSVSPSG